MIKKKSWLMIITLIIINILIIANVPNYSYATDIDDPISNPSIFNPSDAGSDDVQTVASRVGPVINTITTIGIMVALIVIIVLGIKYMIGSVQEKAEYKKTMTPYIVGVIMLAGISIILKIVSQLISGIDFTVI